MKPPLDDSSGAAGEYNKMAELSAKAGIQQGHFVVFAGGALDIIQSGFRGTAEAGHNHLRQADIFRPGDAGLLILAEFLDAEVRTHAGDAGIAEKFAELGA